MSRFRDHWTFILTVLTVLIPTAISATEVYGSVTLSVGGYFKNMFLHSKTVFPETETYDLDLTRLRLEFDGNLSRSISYDIQYDNEIFFGSYLDTAEFHSRKNNSGTYWDLESSYLDQSNVFARHGIHRGYLTFALPSFDIRVGRQRIAWGTARLWNPTDILNPLNPIQIEREEREGVDVLLVQNNLGALSQMSLVYAPQDRKSDSSVAGRFRTHAGGFDLSGMAGNFRNDKVVGLDFAGQIGQIGVRGELVNTRTEEGKNYIQTVIGGDYTFTNTLSIYLEYFYNGQGSSQESEYDFAGLYAGEALGLARHYLGAYAGYDITPLLAWDNYLIVNLDDGSVFLFPEFGYSLTANLDWSVGFQLFNGEPGSEYGTFENIFFSEIQWFF